MSAPDKKKILTALKKYGLEELSNQSSDLIENLEDDKLDALVRATERMQIIELRKPWSNGVLYLIAFITFFDAFIIVNIGYEWMTFTNMGVITIILDGLFKIFGLAFIVVNYLFDRNK